MSQEAEKQQELSSVFKFKKKTSKKIGDFDVIDNTEWTLLIKPQIQDLPLFVHYRKLWNVEEKSEVTDEDGNVIQEKVEMYPAFEVKTGFVKDGKFIVQQQKSVVKSTYHEIDKLYMKSLDDFIKMGYEKDWNNYNGEEPIVPGYYANERTPLTETGDDPRKFILQKIAAASQSQSTTKPNTKVAPTQQNPSPNNKKNHFGFLKMKPKTTP